MTNAKIMVNFAINKLISTEAEVGSDEYQFLIREGFSHAGDAKVKEGILRIFWKPEFFSNKHKYYRPHENKFHVAKTLKFHMDYVFGVMEARNPERSPSHEDINWTLETFSEFVNDLFDVQNPEALADYWKINAKPKTR